MCFYVVQYGYPNSSLRFFWIKYKAIKRVCIIKWVPDAHDDALGGVEIK